LKNQRDKGDEMMEKKKRSQAPGSRHKDRHMISFAGEVYHALHAAAARNGDTVAGEARQRLTKSLRKDGFLPDQKYG
jgi:hypothetical protein